MNTTELWAIRTRSPCTVVDVSLGGLEVVVTYTPRFRYLQNKMLLLDDKDGRTSRGCHEEFECAASSKDLYWIWNGNLMVKFATSQIIHNETNIMARSFDEAPIGKMCYRTDR